MAVKKKVPMRKCVGCGEMKPKKELIRILRTEEEEFVIDTTGKKNGRGAYLCPQKACFEQAVKNRGLERSFKQAIPQEVYERLEMDEISSLDKILSLISLATKAGRCASGEFLTEGQTKSGRASLVVVQKTLQIIQRKNSVICVNFIKFQ